MKVSIKNVFSNIVLFMLFVLITSIIAVVFTFEQANSFKKIDILNNQKAIISALHKIDKKDLDLALIQFNGKSTQLHHQTEKLRNLYKYDFIGNYVLNNSQEYFAQLDKLTNLVNTYNAKAYQYYKSTDKSEQKLYETFNNSFENLNNHISSIIFQNIVYDNKKFGILQYLAIFALVVILFFFILYKNRLSKIYEDIAFLYSPKSNNSDYNLYTIEADAIHIRMKRKPEVQVNPANIDQITGIYNNKGLVNSYSEKRGMKESNFTAVSIIEVDNFSKTKRAFPQEFTHAVLKKIAYTISLYEQATDVIARTDYNQFTIILSRATKEQAYKEIDAIRESISELKFVTQTKTAIQMTVSGGFFIKPNNLALNNSLAEAKDILEYAKKHSTNKIYQKRDLEEI